jgi:hypothetical protein
LPEDVTESLDKVILSAQYTAPEAVCNIPVMAWCRRHHETFCSFGVDQHISDILRAPIGSVQ